MTLGMSTLLSAKPSGIQGRNHHNINQIQAIITTVVDINYK